MPFNSSEIKIWIDRGDFSRSVKICPHTESNNGNIVINYPDGAGHWVCKEIGPNEIVDGPILEMPESWARELFLELRKIYDPEDTVSIDSVKAQTRHLEDMRSLLFSKLNVKRPEES